MQILAIVGAVAWIVVFFGVHAIMLYSYFTSPPPDEPEAPWPWLEDYEW
jgi:hypothetical protein